MLVTKWLQRDLLTHRDRNKGSTSSGHNSQALTFENGGPGFEATGKTLTIPQVTFVKNIF